MQWTVDSAEMEVRTKMQPEEYVSAFDSIGKLLNADPETA
jgi:hypothetical protein